MAKNKVDACMFCGVTPCECNAKPKRKYQTKVEKLTPFDPGLSDLKPEPVSRGSRLGRMRADARTAPPLAIPEPPVPRRTPRRAVDTATSRVEQMKSEATTLDEDTVLLNAALRVLLQAELIDAGQLSQYPEALAEPTIEEQKLIWKARWRDGRVQL